jgi:hypothetical protein
MKKLLLVGFVRSVEYGLLYAIEKMTGCTTQPCFVTASEFHFLMQERWENQVQCGDAAPSEVKFESVQTSEEMARILCSYGIGLESDDVAIGKCKEYLWARLKSARRTVDILFKAE